MFLSLALRMLVNVEAFNAVETVGNVTKHRRAPMIIPSSSGYKLVYVPAVSGEAIANAFQRNLVVMTKHLYGSEGLKPPLTEWDERFEFVKFMDSNHLTPELRKIVKSKDSVQVKKHRFEVEAVKSSIIADVGGFLYAEEELPVKRTSRIYTGYMLPTYDAIEAVAIEAQFHARHVPAEAGGGKGEAQRAAQMIYYVEVSSALYGLTVNLDIDGIGKTSLVKVEDVVNEEERVRRVRASLAALEGLFLGSGFGAKLSRFLPVRSVESAVATLSEPIAFTASPPQIPTYITDTAKRAEETRKALKSLGIEPRIHVVAYSRESIEGVETVETLEKLFTKVNELILKPK